MRRSKKGMMFIFCVILFVGCNYSDERNGFNLQKFDVVNVQLDSIINKIIDVPIVPKFTELDSLNNWRNKYFAKEEGEYIVLMLRMYNECPEFLFTSVSGEEISDNYIFNDNVRVIGYIEGKTPIIVLTKIQDVFDFELNFHKFIIPTSRHKYFDDICRLDYHYGDSVKHVPVTKLDTTPIGTRKITFDAPPTFEPTYHYYTYKDSYIVRSKY